MTFAERPDALYGVSDLGLTSRGFRDQPRNSPAMPGYDQGFAQFHIVEQFGEPGLGFGGLYFTHSVSTSWIDWSIVWRQRKGSKLQ